MINFSMMSNEELVTCVLNTESSALERILAKRLEAVNDLRLAGVESVDKEDALYEGIDRAITILRNLVE